MTTGSASAFGEEVELTAQVVFLRRKSARLVFADTITSCGLRTEVVFKAWTDSGLTVEDLLRLRATVRLGDTVHLQGRWENDECTSMLVTHFSLLERWRDTHPGVQFQAQPGVRSIPDAADDMLCKYFLNTGKCALGEACPYRHEHGTPAAAQWVSDRVAARRIISGNRYAGDEELMHVKAHRAEVFASWLVAKCGLDALCGGSGVLDIAGGGSGGLSFALHVLHGVPVTTVDPRPVCLTALQRKRAAEMGVHISPQFPDQLQVWFDDSTWQLSTGRSMLVGMHPDQATDAIVDCALQAGIPFAVVPCCVFPSLMAASRGARLRSREQLIAYLVNKRPGEIMVEWLPFDGASQVLFWRGPQGAASTAMRNLLPPWFDERMTQQC